MRCSYLSLLQDGFERSTCVALDCAFGVLLVIYLNLLNSLLRVFALLPRALQWFPFNARAGRFGCLGVLPLEHYLLPPTTSFAAGPRLKYFLANPLEEAVGWLSSLFA